MENEGINDIVDVSMEEGNINLQHQTTPEQSSKKNKRVETETNSDKSIGYLSSEKRQRGELTKVRVFRNMKWQNWTLICDGSCQIGANCSGEAQVCSGKQSQALKIVQNEATKVEPSFGDHTADGTSKEVEDYESFEAIGNFLIMKYEQAAKKEEEDLNNKMADVSARNIPPHDMSATTPQQAYPLEKIINRGEWMYLMDIIELLVQGKNIPPERYPVFVCNRIYKIGEAKDRKMKDALGSVFSYMNHLIKFKDKHSVEGCEDHIFPKVFTRKFNDMFADQESKGLAGDKRDLLIRYVLVLTLFVDDFKTEFTDIAKDLRMPSGDLRSHFECLGCKFVWENSVMLATLPAPLKFLEVG